MNNKMSYAIFIALLVILTLFLYMMAEKDKFNWNQTYRLSGNQPYDFDLFVNLVNQSYPNKMVTKDLEKALDNSVNDSNKLQTYVFAGDSYYISKKEFQKLLNFVEKGNQAFIISTGLPDSLVKMLGQYYDFEKIYNYHYGADSVFYQFNHPELIDDNYLFQTYYKDKTVTRRLIYLENNQYFQQANFTSLGILNFKYHNKYITGDVFIKTKLGKGEIFIHVDPMCFTNYHVRESYGFEYISKAFGHVRNKDILWDVSSTKWKSDFEFSSFITKNNSPLEFILTNRELTWAWYIILGTGFLFLIFGSKRLQKVIPVIKNRKNTSLQFIHTISSMYKPEQSNKQIATLKMEHFLWLIRNIQSNCC